MGKVHIGVTAVGGHKLWGVVGGGRLTVGGGKLRAGHARPLQSDKKFIAAGVRGNTRLKSEGRGGGVKREQ